MVGWILFALVGLGWLWREMQWRRFVRDAKPRLDRIGEALAEAAQKI